VREVRKKEDRKGGDEPLGSRRDGRLSSTKLTFSQCGEGVHAPRNKGKIGKKKELRD